MPPESGNRAKTDKKDSSKLARLLAKGELKAVFVPTAQERSHRHVLRHRSQLIGARTRTQLQIKAFLAFHGVPCPECTGKWSGRFLEELQRLERGDECLRHSFTLMLEQVSFFNVQILTATRRLRVLASTPAYRERFALLRTVSGVGLLTAMEILLEIGAMSRFSNAEKLAAYAGLMPTQHSSGEKIRMGHITGMGKANLRGVLTEAS
jgi:transposase